MFQSPRKFFKRLLVILFDMFIIILSVRQSMGVPIALTMGCGKSLDLTADKRRFCCEHFNLDCTGFEKIDPQHVLRNVKEEVQRLIPRRRSFRLLGENCGETQMKCATGLYCRQGTCVRRRSRAHLKSLMQRGKFVEQEEREEIGSDSDEEREDPLPAQKGLILEGQSVKTSDIIVRPDKAARDVVMKPRKTPTPQSPDADQSGAKKNEDVKYSRTEAITDLKRSLNEEEDELAANVADLLSLKLGFNLNSVELHSVREVIAGTLDERAEREDEIVQSETERGMEGDLAEGYTAGFEQRVEAAEGESSREYHYYNHYEPLVQCPSKKKRHSPAKEVSESLTALTEGLRSTLHA